MTVVSEPMIRLSGIACIVGGIFLAVFMMVHPWDQLLGAAIARTTRWQMAHLMHFIGAAFTLLGLLGIYARQRDRFGALGHTGFVLSFIGNAMFVGTGMITAFIWPMLAVYAPNCVEVGGPIFGPPHAAVAFVLTALIWSVGYILFGAAMLKAGVFPPLATIMLVVGGILGMMPPNPVGFLPWAGLVAGGILYGLSLVWIGFILWQRHPAHA